MWKGLYNTKKLKEKWQNFVFGPVCLPYKDKNEINPGRTEALANIFSRRK